MYSGVPMTTPVRVLASPRVEHARDAEVEHLDPAFHEEHVVGLEIAMDDALGVSRCEHVENAVGDLEDLALPELAPFTIDALGE